jgi:hypothetical protein
LLSAALRNDDHVVWIHWLIGLFTDVAELKKHNSIYRVIILSDKNMELPALIPAHVWTIG